MSYWTNVSTTRLVPIGSLSALLLEMAKLNLIGAEGASALEQGLEERSEECEDQDDSESVAPENSDPTPVSREMKYFDIENVEGMDWKLTCSPWGIRSIAAEVLSRKVPDEDLGDNGMTENAFPDPPCEIELTFAEFQRLIIRIVEELIKQNQSGRSLEAQPTISSCLPIYVNDVLLPALIETKPYVRLSHISTESAAEGSRNDKAAATHQTEAIRSTETKMTKMRPGIWHGHDKGQSVNLKLIYSPQEESPQICA
ncbi:hypothetical protein FOL47_001464 [Perkinsus chesapeaki]|uniref:Uncharacterized protein n=1 Tax=Perkinsus chesapeaki TaxID=330153 RepID=A0A7J6MK21_PERCH|nr:hypothetical protein FOL47_001464 [Perkinsus chesapeaki]